MTRHIDSAVRQAVIGENENWGSSVRNYAISPTGDRIAVLLSDGLDHTGDNIFVYDLHGNLLLSFRNDNGGEQGLAFWRDNDHLLTSGCDLTQYDRDGLKLWCLGRNPTYSHFLADTPLTNINLYLATVSPSGRYVLGRPRHGGLICVDTHQDNEWWEVDLGTPGGHYAFSDTERYMAAWNPNEWETSIIDMKERQRVFRGKFLCFTGEDDRFLTLEDAHSSSRSERLMSVNMWNPLTMQKVRTHTRGWVNAGRGAPMADGRVLAVIESNNIYLWDAADLNEILYVATDLQFISQVFFSNSGNALIALEHTFDNTSRVVAWRLR